jgi:hypothetical protein
VTVRKKWNCSTGQSPLGAVQPMEGSNVKVIPQQAEVAKGVPGRLRPRSFLTFGTTRVVGRQPYTRAAFTPEEIPGTHFQRFSRPQDTWFRRRELRKKSPVTPPGIDSGTVRLAAQCLNHYATLGPIQWKEGRFSRYLHE